MGDRRKAFQLAWRQIPTGDHGRVRQQAEIPFVGEQGMVAGVGRQNDSAVEIGVSQSFVACGVEGKIDEAVVDEVHGLPIMFQASPGNPEFGGIDDTGLHAALFEEPLGQQELRVEELIFRAVFDDVDRPWLTDATPAIPIRR